MASSAVDTRPFRLFVAQVRHTRRLSPSFLRVTFTGEDLDAFADNGFDQRIKLVLPRSGTDFDELGRGGDWYAAWRRLRDDVRPPLRTYTVRAVRPALREVDVDVVLHGDAGPASRWASTARPGEAVGLVGPDRGFDGVHGGVEFRPPADVRTVLLAGDETAVPAIAGILERLPVDATGEAVLEVPTAADILDLGAPDHISLTWLPRRGAGHGARLRPAVEAAAERLGFDHANPAQRTAAPTEDNEDLVWDVPDPEHSRVEPRDRRYAWLAGEAGVITDLRRYLVNDLGVDRRSVAFMGYWRLGRALDE